MIAEVEPLTTARVLRGPFDYRAPDGTKVGDRLEVPFGRQRLVGVVTGLKERSELPDERLVAPLRTIAPAIPADLVALALWMARECCSTPARALSLVAPPRGREQSVLWAHAAREPEAEERLTDGQRALLAALPRPTGRDLAALRRLEKRGLVRIDGRPARRAPEHLAVGAAGAPPPLTDAQAAAVDAVLAAEPGERLLLHGVTGSGKTEVYLRAVDATLAAGRGAIVLVPEIGLTPQAVTRFTARLGDTVAVLHSGLSDGERHDEWLRLARGQARVCVGPRSAVFAPIDRLGLIVLDEEHDASFKHEGDPRYDARLVAQRRAEQHGAVLLAGTATPRPEAWASMRRVTLPERVDGAALPPVEVVDLREARSAVHPRTHEALREARKAIVLLNRRGWSNYLSCRSCGHVWRCPNCDVTLVLHRAAGHLACHHCGHREDVPSRCAACASAQVARHGAGTERLAAELADAGLPVLRLDAQTGAGGGAARVLRDFARAERAVLVGTQLVAKGHDFPDVELGVVLDADATLRFPDFRAEERTFALVTQLAGRAGRGARGGRVLVQTTDPDSEAIAFAARHDAEGFVAAELERRRALAYPPFATLIRVVCSSDAEAAPGAAMAAALAVRDRLRHAAGPGASRGGLAGLLPPVDAAEPSAGARSLAGLLEPEPAAAAPDPFVALGPAPLFRLRGRERGQVLVKAADRAAAIAAVDAAVRAVAGERLHRAAAFSVDVDPQ